MKNLFSMKGLSALGLVIVIVLLFFLFGSYPGWQHSHNWGYAPMGGFGVVLIIIVILVALDKL